MGKKHGKGLARRVVKTLFGIDIKRKHMTAARSGRWRQRLEGLYGELGLQPHPLQSDPSVVPPLEVLKRIQGSSKADPDTFFGTGSQLTYQYLEFLRRHGFDPKGVERMLDLGFGSGRLLVQFLPLGAELHGCDVNPRALEWTRETLGNHAHLRLTEREPPLPYPGDHFDLVVATSVFTHTPMAAQPGWIAELHRVLRPGGCAVVTVHDFCKVPPRDTTRGWMERANDRGLHMNTFVSEAKLRELWGGHFEVLGFRRDPPRQAHMHLRARQVVAGVERKSLQTAAIPAPGPSASNGKAQAQPQASASNGTA